MKKRQFYAIAAIVLFFGLGATLDFGISTDNHLRNYQRRIERSLHKMEGEVRAILADTSFLSRILLGVEKLPSPKQQADLKYLLDLTAKPYNICIYRKDSLIFWLNNKAFLSPAQVQFFAGKKEKSHLLRLSNGYFEIITAHLVLQQNDSVFAAALVPLKREYSSKSELLPNSFVTGDFSIPADVFLSETPSKFSIENLENQPIAWLGATGAAKDRTHLQIVFFIYTLGFIALGVLVNELAVKLVRRFEPWVGAAFVFGTVAAVWWLTIKLGFSQHFATFQTFSKVFTEPILEGVNSLGELLIGILLLVWMMVFFNREFTVKEFRHPSLPIRIGLTALNYFAITLAMLMVTYIFKSIVLDSTIVFDFENVFNLNTQSVLAMIGVVLLLLALFLFSHRMMMATNKIGLRKNWRMAAMGAALLLAYPVVTHVKDLYLSPVFFLLAATIYLLLFELFVEVKNLTLSWFVGWLMLFAGFTSVLLYKYNNDKDYRRRAEYAKAIASFEDEQAEAGFDEISRLMQGTASMEKWHDLARLFAPQPLPKEEARDIVEGLFSTNKYLFHNYKFKLTGFYLRTGETALNEQQQTFGEMEELFHKAKRTRFANLRFLTEKTRHPGYLIRTEIPTEEPLLIFLYFQRSFSTPSKVYTELLLDKKYKNLEELDNYDYGIYQDGVLFEERNNTYSQLLSDALPPVGEVKTLKLTSKRSELLYHAPNNTVIKIGKNSGGYIKPLSLFSYVFTLLTLAVVLFCIINYFTDALPGNLNFLRQLRPSLRNQLQVWVISMILVSFLGIGFVTVWYFQQSSNEYHQGRLDRKVTSALANVNYEIKAWRRERAEEHQVEQRIAQRIERELGMKEREKYEREELEKHAADLDAFSLSELIPLISEVHRLDVNIYDLQGNLIASSEQDIFKKGLVAPKMGAHAYHQLTRLGYDRSDQDESIGTLQYLAAYVPLKNMDDKTLAYMGIPYYARQRELRSDVRDFMSTLLNVYVFLLLIAGGLAIFISNSITKPLSQLNASLQKLRLGGNQKVFWKRKDEIGDLVNEYNKAVEKIEESTKLLAQSEREDAWREMAKQVAHEIKNPLTPMKLSIQYLKHAYHANAQNIEPLLDRVTNTLIEQIDSLTQIANEFSNFAKMPRPENAHFSITELAGSVHHLFSNERPDMCFNLNLPKQEFTVFADKNHVTRVLNNLLKNAIQAIPDDRQGEIDLFLYKKEDKVVVEVTDNGTGIPPEIQAKVFSPNFSTKSSGTGLGLAICKSIMESFGGKIWFETTVGEGTTFFMELPLVQERELEVA